MSTESSGAVKPETNNGLQGEQYVDEVVERLSSFPRFFHGVSRHILAVRRVRQLEATVLELKATNKRLEHENTHDDLTGLLNKKAWRENIDARIKEGKAFGLIFMDMDAFKDVNDKLGHDKGDEVLKKFGQHMTSSFRRPGDNVTHESYFRQPDDNEIALGRYGGDEFGIIVNLSDREQPDGLSIEQRMKSVEEYTDVVIAKFVKGQDPEVQVLRFDVSRGIAIWRPEEPLTSTALFHQADVAMYAAKIAKGGAVR